jgi:hypothetical protein
MYKKSKPDEQLHQPTAIDAKDTDGHTALMWAAYQGIYYHVPSEP